MKNFKQLWCLPLALSISLATSSSVFADNTINNHLPNNSVNRLTLNHTQIANSVTYNQTRVTSITEVVPQQTFTLVKGQANIPFTYQNDIDIKLILKNVGKKTIHYEINFPDGTRNLIKSSLASGQQQEWNLPLYDVYGRTSLGLWNIFAVTTDGSTGKLTVHAY